MTGSYTFHLDYDESNCDHLTSEQHDMMVRENTYKSYDVFLKLYYEFKGVRFDTNLKRIEMDKLMRPIIVTVDDLNIYEDFSLEEYIQAHIDKAILSNEDDDGCEEYNDEWMTDYLNHRYKDTPIGEYLG